MLLLLLLLLLLLNVIVDDKGVGGARVRHEARSGRRQQVHGVWMWARR